MTEDRSNPFQAMAEKWPSGIVSRAEVPRFTGGLISEKYIANLDSVGKGCPGRFRIGRKIAYSITEMIAWLEARSTPVPERHPKVGEKAEGTPPDHQR